MNPTLRDYLDALYPPGTPGELLAYSKKPFTRRFGVPANLGAYARQIEQMDRAGLDVYQTINALDGQAIRGRGLYARGLETEVVAVVALVADVDAAGKPGHNYPTQTAIVDALADMPLQPSVIVVSGRHEGGLHPYWLLNLPFAIGSDEDRTRIKWVSEQWQRLLRGKLAPFELDSTYDLVRVLRPIGSLNKKYVSKVSALVFQPNRRFNVEDFERYLPRPEPARPWTPPPSATGGSISERAARYVATIPGAVSGQGGHDTTFHVAAVLVEGFALSIADALPIIRGWNTTCTPPWSEGELLHKLRSADANAERRGYMLSDSVVAPTNGTKITRLVLAGTAR
jgi:hypothetical protein